MTEEERIAQARLDAAIAQFAHDMGYDGFCDSYILVMHQLVMTVDGSMNNSRYPIAMMGGSQPDHTCMGLLQIGSDMIRGTGRRGETNYEE